MSKAPLNIEQIHELLPHRYPMLMLDRVLEITEEWVIAEKLVSANEPHFRGHFPNKPIMPGVLILEALAQAAGIWAVVNEPQLHGLSPALAGLDKVRFRRPVVPGDTLRLHAQILHQRGRVFKAACVARVDGETVAEATLLAAFVEWEDS